MKLTVRSLKGASGPTIVGDVAYLSVRQFSNQQLSRIVSGFKSENWYRDLLTGHGFTPPKEGGQLNGFVSLETLNCIQKSRHEGSWPKPGLPFSALDKKYEPDWFKRLSRPAKSYLRQSYAITDGIDPLGIVLHFPNQGFGYIIADDTMASDACQVFHLHRLQQVKQLSFLHDPKYRSLDSGAASMMFDHTRLCHSYDTFVVANLIAKRLGLTGTERSTLLTAAISHDALTPAGGDSVKLIDPPMFDEDAHYPELLEGSAWEAYREQYGVDRNLLVSTILGEGFLGSILDVADKSAYLARDVFYYLGGHAQDTYDYVNTGFAAIRELASHTDACALWESAVSVNGTLAFTDIPRVTRFLILRALMFREFYCNPYARFFEYLVGKVVVKHLYATGAVTREQLLHYGDWWIEGKIDEFVGYQGFLHHFYTLDNSRVEEHLDVEMARKRAAQFTNDDSVIIILDDYVPSTKDGTRRFHVVLGGKAVPFFEACPHVADEVGRIMTFPKRVRLYFIATKDLSVPVESIRRIKKVMQTM